MKKSVYIAIVSVLAVALLGSAIYLFSYFWQGKKSEDAYDKLRNDVTASTGEAPTTTAPETTNPGETTEFIPDPNETAPEETFPLNVDYQGFYDKNKNDDFVGWLRIEGTKLDYPVMQSSADNANYYLYRTTMVPTAAAAASMPGRSATSSLPATISPCTATI